MPVDVDQICAVPGVRPELDAGFLPAVLWNRAYQAMVDASGRPVNVRFVLLRPDGSGSLFQTRILPLDKTHEPLTLRYLERTLKSLLWQRGASRVYLSGCEDLVPQLAGLYSMGGDREFDCAFFGEKVYRQPFVISSCSEDQLPDVSEPEVSLGGHTDGCRIGFDLGGSDRKCAAVIDGEVVFSEEIKWDPYFEKDPAYHLDGVMDSLQRAAAHLPRVDAIGGSAAGIYVNNEVRAASLFRGVSEEDFNRRVRRMFFELKERWGNVPFELVNDGEVTALAGSMTLRETGVLGISMGTSLAAGYVNLKGRITPWLNELAFVPIDLRRDAPRDEWSGDLGCGVQYLSQQAVARLAPAAGMSFPEHMPLADRLVEVQERMAAGDDASAGMYVSLGTYLGYAIASYADFYEMNKVLLLGRVISGRGGSLIMERAEQVLRSDFPELAERIKLVTPGEKEKRHGQAVAAASLPALQGGV